MDLDLESYCEVYPLGFDSDTDAIDSENPLSQNDIQQQQHFYIIVECTNMFVLNARNLDTHCDTTNHHFPDIPKDTILMQETKVLEMLSQMGVPDDAHKSMAAKIMSCAQDMAKKAPKNQRVLCLSVVISITRVTDDAFRGDDDDDGVVEELTEDQGDGLVPASESSIEDLERVMVGSVLGIKGRKCVICFEEFKVGEEAIRMPCLHLYHCNCILGWLHNGNSCPLCRFQMPTNEKITDMV